MSQESCSGTVIAGASVRLTLHENVKDPICCDRPNRRAHSVKAADIKGFRRLSIPPISGFSPYPGLPGGASSIEDVAKFNLFGDSLTEGSGSSVNPGLPQQFQASLSQHPLATLPNGHGSAKHKFAHLR